MIKIRKKTSKSASVTCWTSAQTAVAPRKQTSVSLIADKLAGSKLKRHDIKPPWYCPACELMICDNFLLVAFGIMRCVFDS